MDNSIKSPYKTIVSFVTRKGLLPFKFYCTINQNVPKSTADDGPTKNDHYNF